MLRKPDQSGGGVEINAELGKFVDFRQSGAENGFLMARAGRIP